jgi:hypothetical protein
MEPASSSALPSPPPAEARRTPPEELKLRRRTLETVLEQCQRALEMMHEDGLGTAAEGASFTEGEGEEEEEEEEEGSGDSGGVERAPPPPPSEADYEADEVRGGDLAVHLVLCCCLRVRSNLGSGIRAGGSIDA